VPVAGRAVLCREREAVLVPTRLAGLVVRQAARSAEMAHPGSAVSVVVTVLPEQTAVRR
jgi:hypothetical protein